MVMNRAAGLRIAVTMGLLAMFLGAVSPLGAWAAEPAKQEMKGKRQPQARKNLPTPETTGLKFSTAETAGNTPSCFGEAPTLDKVTPDEGKAGDKVVITGSNFGQAACMRSISFGPGHPAQFQQTDNRITTTVPSGVKKGLVLLTVTTASGESSKAFLMK